MRLASMRKVHPVALFEPIDLVGLHRAAARAVHLLRSTAQGVLAFWAANGSVASLPYRH